MTVAADKCPLRFWSPVRKGGREGGREGGEEMIRKGDAGHRNRNDRKKKYVPKPELAHPTTTNSDPVIAPSQSRPSSAARH
jgi:hypothetical protein